jgi:hypothetical protein
MYGVVVITAWQLAILGLTPVTVYLKRWLTHPLKMLSSSNISEWHQHFKIACRKKLRAD